MRWRLTEGQCAASRMSNTCVLLCVCTQPWDLLLSLLDPSVLHSNVRVAVPAEAHGCSSLMRWVVLQLMSAVETERKTKKNTTLDLVRLVRSWRQPPNTHTHVDSISWIEEWSVILKQYFNTDQDLSKYCPVWTEEGYKDTSRVHYPWVWNALSNDEKNNVNVD